MTANTRILFVDDEEKVLSGLRRMLRGFRKQWDMGFAKGGNEAVQMMAEDEFDVVITDMRMPGMDGAQLLTHVTEEYPETVRIVLSGQSEKERIFRAIGMAHQYLSKPCDPEILKSTVARACSLRDALTNEDLKRVVSRIPSVPCLPNSLKQLSEELESTHTSLKRVGTLIASDVGMTAKILQLVSTAFFGSPQSATSAEQAAALLGLDLLKELVIDQHIFSLTTCDVPGFAFEELNQHSVEVAHCAKRIAQSETDNEEIIGQAFLSGMLHDIGKVVLASSLPKQYSAALESSRKNGVTLWHAEMHTFGASHAEVGSYLLGLWGLPDAIVEAVATYRQPQNENDGFQLVTALHVANILKRKNRASYLPEELPHFGSTYLANPNFAEQMKKWCKVAQPMTSAS